MQPGSLRTLAILAALVAGAFLPSAAAAAEALPWTVAAMLFIAFLGIPLRAMSPEPLHLRLFLANLVLAALGAGAGWMLGGREVALAGFFAGIAPTAAAAPVVTRMLGGNVAFVLVAFLYSNLGVAGLLAIALPWLPGLEGEADFLPVVRSIGFIVVAPLGMASILRKLCKTMPTWIDRLGPASFILWLATLFLIGAKTSDYLRHDRILHEPKLLQIALLAGGVCAASFATGAWLGSPSRRIEGAQILGQKNTTFAIYLALVHANPVVALGPTFYALWHNLWNTWNLHRTPRNSQRRTPSDPDHLDPAQSGPENRSSTSADIAGDP